MGSSEVVEMVLPKGGLALAGCWNIPEVWDVEETESSFICTATTEELEKFAEEVSGDE